MTTRNFRHQTPPSNRDSASTTVMAEPKEPTEAAEEDIGQPKRSGSNQIETENSGANNDPWMDGRVLTSVGDLQETTSRIGCDGREHADVCDRTCCSCSPSSAVGVLLASSCSTSSWSRRARAGEAQAMQPAGPLLLVAPAVCSWSRGTGRLGPGRSAREQGQADRDGLYTLDLGEGPRKLYDLHA